MTKEGHFGTVERQFATEIGNRVVERLREFRWTNEDLSEKSGLSAAKISMIRRGQARPLAYQMVQIANALRLPVAWLLTGETAKERKADAPAALPARTDRNWEICWSCGCKTTPKLYQDDNGKQFYRCERCLAEGLHENPKVIDPRISWNAEQHRRKFLMEQTAVSGALASMAPDALTEDVTRTVLLALEAVRLMAD